MFSSLLRDARTFFLLAVFSGILSVMDAMKFLDLPKSVVQKITIPIQYGLYEYGRSAGRQVGFIILTRKTAQENKALTEQLAQILSENANLRRKLAEADGFLQQQKSLNPKTFNLLPARPIGISRYLRIDKGGDDGLALGQAVVYKDNFLGVVKNLTGKSAEVILPSDPDFKTEAFASNKNGKSRGVLSGEFGSEMLLDKVLHQEPIEKGDLVYTEGTEASLPRGLVIGQVSEVSVQENEVFKQAKVKPIFNAGTLDLVFVIID